MDFFFTELNPFKPEFTIVIFIHYKPQIAVTILDLYWMKMIWSGWKIKKNYHVLANQFHGNFRSKTLGCRQIMFFFRDVKWCFNASWGLKGLINILMWVYAFCLIFEGNGRWHSSCVIFTILPLYICLFLTERKTCYEERSDARSRRREEDSLRLSFTVSTWWA